MFGAKGLARECLKSGVSSCDTMDVRWLLSFVGSGYFLSCAVRNNDITVCWGLDPVVHLHTRVMGLKEPDPGPT